MRRSRFEPDAPVRVPLVVRYPDGAARPASARVAAGVSHLDLWPTFAVAEDDGHGH